MKLHWRNYNLQLKHVFTISGSSRTTTPVVLTEIEHDGVVGYGEASLPPYLGETQESVDHFLKKIDLSLFNNPLEIEEILQYVDRIEENNTAAKASVDIALHDLVGKMLGKSWHQIWHLDKEKAPDTTYTIGIDTIDMIKQKTREVASDFNILKVKLGSENDKQIIEAIRSITNLPLAVDANQGWKDRIYALEMIHWLKEKGVVMIEQPLPKDDLNNNARLMEESPLPVFADESVRRLNDIKRLKGVFSGINIKLMKCTGMHEARKMVDFARSLNMQVMIGCMTETSCAISAAAQLSPAVDFADLDGALLITNDCYSGMQVKSGRIMLNDLPGIGVIKL